MLMIIGLVLVVVVAGFAAFLYWAPQLTENIEARVRAQRKEAIEQSFNAYVDAQEELAEEMPDATPDTPELYAPWWYAVRSESSEAVLGALGIEAPLSCNWRSASVLTSNPVNVRTFVSPPLHGWVLIAGGPDPAVDWEEGQAAEDYMPEVWNKTKSLSATFGEAQFFCASVEGFWACVRAVEGEIVAAYAHSDAADVPSPWDRGMEDIEFPAEMMKRQKGASDDTTPEQRRQLLGILSADSIARQWSVNPQAPYPPVEPAKSTGFLERI